jgi:hypothetical protein
MVPIGLGDPQSRSGCCGEEKIFQPLPALEPPIIQSVAQRYTAELSRLLIIVYIFLIFCIPATLVAHDTLLDLTTSTGRSVYITIFLFVLHPVALE